MITYQDIYDALRKEKYSEQLQKLPQNFLEEIAAYFKEKRAIINKENELFSDVVDKTKKQLDSAMAAVKELLFRRRKKILNLSIIASETGLQKKDFENMLQQERELFETVTAQLGRTEKSEIAALTNEAPSFKHTLLRFSADVESFVGTSGEQLGPFKTGEVANLPSDIAAILIQAGKAEEIKNQ